MATAEDRKPLVITDFRKGVRLAADSLEGPGFLRLTGFKFGARIGSLESRGGMDDWDLGVDFTYIQGFKRWYRADGGVNTFLIGVAGGTQGIYLVNLHSKTASSLGSISEIMNQDEPALFVDCGDQLIVIPSMTDSRPYSIKRQEFESISGDGGIVARKLGLDPPTQGFAITENSISTTNSAGASATDDGIDNGTYFYTYTYVYGTPSNPTLYGESGPGPQAGITVTGNTSAALGVINQITGLPSFGPNGVIRAIRIYRTKKNATTFYRIGEIRANDANTFFNDAIDDASLDLSLILPTYTGLPDVMDCAEWSQTDQRLWWFDKKTGYLRYSAAGRPDVNPSNQYLAVGDLGFRGRGIKFIQDQRYVFKEDGIYRIFGDAPGYVSRKVSSVRCVSRGSFAEMPDGIYFLGAESGELRVYKFDGNSAVPISGALEMMVPNRFSTTAKQAVGRRVQSEYWLSITTPDARYALYPVPWNNVILPYDYRYQAWAGPFPCQAAGIEVFDGPGDKGETYIVESDPTSDSSKGNLFRLEDTLGFSNQTNYSNGARAYLKAQSINNRLTIGMFSAISKDTGLQKIDSFQIKARLRGLLGQNVNAGLYDDSRTLNDPVSDPATQQTLEFSPLISTADKFTTGVYGTATYCDNFLEEYQWNPYYTVPKTGIVVDIFHSFTNSRRIQVEALELKANLTGLV